MLHKLKRQGSLYSTCSYYESSSINIHQAPSHESNMPEHSLIIRIKKKMIWMILKPIRFCSLTVISVCVMTLVYNCQLHLELILNSITQILIHPVVNWFTTSLLAGIVSWNLLNTMEAWMSEITNCLLHWFGVDYYDYYDDTSGWLIMISSEPSAILSTSGGESSDPSAILSTSGGELVHSAHSFHF